MADSQLIEQIKEKCADVEVDAEGRLVVGPDKLLDVMKELRDSFGFDFLSNVTAVDYPDHFEVVYHPCRIRDAAMVTVKTRADKKRPRVPSVCGLWGAANWQEREVYDLFGIVFEGHPDLRRIFL
ncbi:MAG: NADH-quinone oxidoreductase subunit C, partial [Desulfotomaculales bacterium]